MSEIEIRKAQEADVADLLQMIRELAIYEKLEHEMVANEALLRKSMFGDRPAAEALLALSDGDPVGMAIYFYNFSSFLGRAGIHLEDLFVRESERGQGIGRALLQAVAQVARQKESGRLEWCVLDWNQPAIDFYQSHGANVVDDWIIFRTTGESLQQLAEKH